MFKKLFITLFILASLSVAATAQAQKGLWTSTAELATIPMSGEAWTAVKDAAGNAFYPPNIYDYASTDNAHILAAAIVYARSGDESYRTRVVTALEYLVANGNPGGETLAWARNVGALALAADLIDYRTPAFEQWLRNMAEVYIGPDGRTVLQLFHQKPNNWGQSAFGMLCSVYAYLGDDAMLKEIRDYWSLAVTGPNPGYKFQYDLSWQYDENYPVLINPAGAMKNGLNIDGVLPEELRRAGSFSDPPVYTNYAWTGLQGMIEGARVLNRYNPDLSIWNVGDRAIYRAIYRLQVAWEQQFGGWAATGNDEWMLPFVDKAYGTDFTQTAPYREAIWDHGKNAGFGYVTLATATSGTSSTASSTTDNSTTDGTTTASTSGTSTTTDPTGGTTDPTAGTTPTTPTAPTVQEAAIVSVDSISTKRMYNTIDGDFSTEWWAKSDGSWIQYDLGATQTLAYISIAWTWGSTCQTAFDVEVSEDGANWSLVYSGQTSGTTTGFENVDLQGIPARFVRIVGHGNTSNRWTRISEVKIFELS